MRSVERPDAHVSIEAWSGMQLAERIDEAMAIYVQAMGYPRYTGSQRAVTAKRHTVHDGFACCAALDADATLVGFGYGYTTRPGQWWHDLVRRAMSAELAKQWLTDGFELSELHVLPEFQGIGIGERLLFDLADSIAHPTMLLSTPDADTRAFRLYRTAGFVDLARDYMFPGDSRPFAVLGARLPLVANES